MKNAKFGGSVKNKTRRALILLQEDESSAGMERMI